MQSRLRLAVIGLGRVGLPLATAFARAGFAVVGYDINGDRIEQLRRGRDFNDQLRPNDFPNRGLTFTTLFDDLYAANVFFIAVPTSSNAAGEPDITAVSTALRSIGTVLKKGDLVVIESTLYPGATQECCLPVLQAASGLVAGRDFRLGYSPERINPGDPAHQLENIVKVVAGLDLETGEELSKLYSFIIRAGIKRASSICAAEAARVLENAQRAINIAFMNEIATIFEAHRLDTEEILDIARTKWNFLDFRPGLIGGHCVGVQLAFMSCFAKAANIQTPLLDAAWNGNESLANQVVAICGALLERAAPERTLITVMGLSYKENVPDLSRPGALPLVKALRANNYKIQLCDPFARSSNVEQIYDLPLTCITKADPCDAIIITVPHRTFVTEGWALPSKLLLNSQGVVLDVAGVLQKDLTPPGVTLWQR